VLPEPGEMREEGKPIGYNILSAENLRFSVVANQRGELFLRN